jgi:hypothetical protein
VPEARAFQERREQVVAKKQIGVAVIAADFTVRDSFQFLLETYEYRAETCESDESTDRSASFRQSAPSASKATAGNANRDW